jgi:peptide deformylase
VLGTYRKASMSNSAAMREFGILQNGTNSLLETATTANLPTDAALVRNVFDRLRHVAGWVLRHHPFRPESAMGIAAPQIGSDLALAIVKYPGTEVFLELVNPKVVGASTETVDGFEGCLSFFDWRGVVRRRAWVAVEHQRPDGRVVREKFTGVMGQAVAHEIDHLNGVFYTDHLVPGTDLMHVSEYRRRLATVSGCGSTRD